MDRINIVVVASLDKGGVTSLGVLVMPIAGGGERGELGGWKGWWERAGFV